MWNNLVIGNRNKISGDLPKLNKYIMSFLDLFSDVMAGLIIDLTVFIQNFLILDIILNNNYNHKLLKNIKINNYNIISSVLITI